MQMSQLFYARHLSLHAHFKPHARKWLAKSHNPASPCQTTWCNLARLKKPRKYGTSPTEGAVYRFSFLSIPSPPFLFMLISFNIRHLFLPATDSTFTVQIPPCKRRIASLPLFHPPLLAVDWCPQLRHTVPETPMISPHPRNLHLNPLTKALILPRTQPRDALTQRIRLRKRPDDNFVDCLSPQH